MSEYKRLTQWNANGASLILGDVQTEEEARNKLKEQFKKACNRLAELEDKLESGELRRLKYKNGDYVYFISWVSRRICYGQVVDWQEEYGYCIVCEDDMISAFCCYGTKEVAEAQLKELQECGNCRRTNEKTRTN